jgi:Raf kinase inhibitor-like YbhB/YbcL family protein
VPPIRVSSVDVREGATLADAQLYNGFGMTGGNISPELRWAGHPDSAQSFAVTCFDPDAPTGSGFWHWIVLNIPAGVTQLVTGAGSGDMKGLPAGAVHHRNDFGSRDYGGAAPPAGDPPHRYIFVVHALDCQSLDLADASAGLIGFNLTMHAVARGYLTALYGH